MVRVFTLMLAACCCSPAVRADVETVMAEDNLEHRSQKAMEEADERFDLAKKAYSAGDLEGYREHMGAVREMAELAHKSLQDSGKPARKKPKYWKRAEKKLRELHRDLADFEKSVVVDDRQLVASVGERVNQIHDEILLAIMSKK